MIDNEIKFAGLYDASNGLGNKKYFLYVHLRDPSKPDPILECWNNLGSPGIAIRVGHKELSLDTDSKKYASSIVEKYGGLSEFIGPYSAAVVFEKRRGRNRLQEIMAGESFSAG